MLAPAKWEVVDAVPTDTMSRDIRGVVVEYAEPLVIAETGLAKDVGIFRNHPDSIPCVNRPKIGTGRKATSIGGSQRPREAIEHLEGQAVEISALNLRLQ